MEKQKRNRNWVQSYFFLIVPKPQEDELLSSWLTRVAFAHRRTLTVFLSLFVKQDGSTISSIDIDFRSNQQLFENLAVKSGLDKRTIINMSLRSEEGYLFTCNGCLYPPKQIRKLKDKRTHYGLMFCPKCLVEDEIPYWRKKWRYHFYTACPKHNVFLVDSCDSCNERIKFAKMKSFDKAVFCDNCCRDLRLTSSINVPQNYTYGIDAINWFKNGLKNGYFFIDGKKINSLWIFQAATRLSLLLDIKEGLLLNEFPMIEDYKRICRKLKRYNSKKSDLIYKSFYLNTMVYYLFQNYPKNFIKFVEDNKLIHRDFVHSFKDISFWFKEMIDQFVPMQDTVGREISECEVLGAIKYLESIDSKITQEEVARVVGCHFTINKKFKRIYKNLLT